MLGRSGLAIAPLVFGGNVFGWTTDEKNSFAILDAFLDLGFNCIDTADVYSRWAVGNSGGESEAIIGRWMKARGNRDKIILATKVGSEMAPSRKGLGRRYIAEACEASLRRIGTDYIDLYFAHYEDPTTPLAETMAGFSDMVRQGKVRVTGASNYDLGSLRAANETARALGHPDYQVLQPHYNLCERNLFEGGLQDYCAEDNLGVITYFSLASGFLTGKYRSESDFAKSVRSEDAKAYVNERGLRILSALESVAAAHSATMAQIALAWLLTRPGVTAPIASATSIGQLNDIAKSASLRLSSTELSTLDTASG